MQKHKFSLSDVVFALFAWSLMVFRFGYRFGTGDQVELLPYTLFLNDPSLYPHDFFLQALHQSVPNERTIMANLLRPFAGVLEVTCFLLQFLSTFVLVLGLNRLAGRFIQNRYLAWLAVLVALIPLNDYTLGNVELYSDCFQASGLAVAVVVWGLNLFLDKRYTGSALLLAAATFIQLLEGLDVMIVLSAVLLVAVLRKEVSWKTFMVFVSIYGLSAGIYLILIFRQKQGPAAVSDAELFDILFLFRHPHHFILATFSKAKVIVFSLLTIAALLFFPLRSTTLFRFVMIGLLGVIVYAVALDCFHSILIANFQFYKVTQWLKFLGVVAFIGFAEELLAARLQLPGLDRWWGIVLGTCAAACWGIILVASDKLPYRVPFELFELKDKDDRIAVCKKVKETIASDAVFVQPFENTELKFYTQLSSFVEFKANVRNRKNVGEWYRRIQLVYGVDINDKVKGFALAQMADDFFFHLTAERLAVLKSEGVTHILTRKEFPVTGGTLILSNNTYAVYKL